MHCKGSSNSSANKTNVGDLGNERRSQTDETARREAKDDGKDEDAGRGLDGDPDGQAEDGRDEGDDDHDVEAANLVGDDSRNDSAKDADGVEDGQDVRHQAGRDTRCLGLQDNVVEGQEHAPEEEEEAANGQDHGQLLEGVEVLLEDKGPGPGRQA